MSRRRVFRVLVAAAVLAAAFAGHGRAQAAAARQAAEVVAPNVYGKGILFAFSGLDGDTSRANPCVAVTGGPGIALEFRLPKDPVLRIVLPDQGEPRFRVVTNDLIVADIPGEPVSLVVGFVSANVVAGRLPRGGRVSLEGGDANVTVHRKDVGGVTQFAFAYDPKDGKRAAEAASGGAGTAIDTLVETRVEFYRKMPTPPEEVPDRVARTLAKAFSVLKANVCGPEGRFRSRWLTPARWPQGDIRLWDAAFGSVGLAHVDAAAARDALRAITACQGEDGFVPARMDLTEQAETPHPPLLAWAAYHVYLGDRDRDRAFLEALYDAASREVKWFVANRMVGKDSGLFAWKSAEESAAAASPRFKQGADFLALDLSCYLAGECRSLQAMAQILGFREDAKKWSDRAESLAAEARKQFWNEEKGFFFDRTAPDGEWVDVWSSAGLLPLWAGIATKEQAERLVKHLADPKKFWTAAPVPSVARDDPAFDGGAWSGAVHLQTNRLLVGGLRRYGYAKTAEALRQRTVEAVAAWYGRTGCLWDFYDCDDRRRPGELGTGGLSAAGLGEPLVRDCAGTAAVLADLVLRPKP